MLIIIEKVLTDRFIKFQLNQGWEKIVISHNYLHLLKNQGCYGYVFLRIFKYSMC